MRIETYTAPAAEPVTTSTAKSFLKVDVSTDDTLIDTMIAAARGLVEEATGRRLITQTLVGYLDKVPGSLEHAWWDGMREGPVGLLNNASIRIPVGPVQSITHVKVYDSAGVATTASGSTYYLATKGYGEAEIVLFDGQTWPTVTPRQANALEVRFVAGYGAAGSNVPSALVLATLNLVAWMYEHRGEDITLDTMPANVKSALAPYRNLRLG